MMLLISAMLLQASPPAAEPRSFVPPPKAVSSSGPIGQAELGPPFREPFVCSQHFEGQLAYAGDALGSDCIVTGGVEGENGFSRLYRTDGRANDDWYGWGAEVLAPADGVVAGLISNPVENVPGAMGRPPATTLQFRRPDGVIIFYGHVADVRVKIGDPVRQGQVVGRVGNNGFARSPHIHVGAYRESTAEPLQIRWDLRAMTEVQNPR